VDAELKQHLIAVEQRIVSSLKGYVNERCEQVGTKLLTEFHQWASPAGARHRAISAALHAIDLEIASNKDLAKKLEGRPPQ
jgi:hypothetical protein